MDVWQVVSMCVIEGLTALQRCGSFVFCFLHRALPYLCKGFAVGWERVLDGVPKKFLSR